MPLACAHLREYPDSVPPSSSLHCGHSKPEIAGTNPRNAQDASSTSHVEPKKRWSILFQSKEQHKMAYFERTNSQGYRIVKLSKLVVD